MKKLKSINIIPLSYIKSVIKINPDSPSGLTWLPRENGQWNGRYANKTAGNKDKINKDKRWNTTVLYNGKRYHLKCHRIIFLLHNGYLTKGKCIDHIDNNPLNNNPDNLRESTNSQNSQNSKKPKTNTSGHKGVHWHKKSGKWRVRIVVNSKEHSFGYFVNLEDAIKVAIAARKKLHGEFGRDE